MVVVEVESHTPDGKVNSEMVKTGVDEKTPVVEQEAVK